MCGPKNPPEDIFKNRESLLKIWENERTARDLNSKLMWESMKYFATIITALIAAHVALLPIVFSKENSKSRLG